MTPICGAKKSTTIVKIGGFRKLECLNNSFQHSHYYTIRCACLILFGASQNLCLFSIQCQQQKQPLISSVNIRQDCMSCLRRNFLDFLFCLLLISQKYLKVQLKQSLLVCFHFQIYNVCTLRRRVTKAKLNYFTCNVSKGFLAQKFWRKKQSFIIYHILLNSRYVQLYSTSSYKQISESLFYILTICFINSFRKKLNSTVFTSVFICPYTVRQSLAINTYKSKVLDFKNCILPCWYSRQKLNFIFNM